ncbi:MAG: hypothetical protein HYZ08_02625 [Candidatus Kerfeldbacteria bacterium]|nr:hypothetical protein [Candidatus Kerfeldbacteria bacterium]
MKNWRNFFSIDDLLGGILLLAVMGLVIIYTSVTNIQGDGKFHTLMAREISETNSALTHFTHTLLSTDGPEKIMAPINYPQTAHVILANLFSLGGEVSVELSGAMFAGITALFTYLLLYRYGRTAAFVTAILVVVFNIRRFIMVPLIEQSLLAATFASLAAAVQWMRSPSVRWSMILGILLGITASLKQQGLLVPLAVGFALVCWCGFQMVRRRKKTGLRYLVVIAVVMTVVMIVPLWEHVARNGTIGYVPGTGTSGFLDRIPIVGAVLDNHFPLDTIAAERVQERIAYINRDPVSMAAVTLSYLAFPVQFSTLVFSTLHLNDALEIGIFALIALLGMMEIARRSRALAFVIGATLGMEILLTWVTQSRIEQYHVIGIAAAVPFLVFGFQFLWKHSPSRSSVILLTLVMVAFMGTNYVDLVHRMVYGNAGRQETENLEAYQELANRVEGIIPKDAVVLGASTNFQYYLRRDMLWLSTGGAAETTTIFESLDPEEAIRHVRNYKIDFVFIEWEQLNRPGLRDFIPPRGLVDYIDHSPYYNEVYSVRRDGYRVLTLYRVNR